MKKLITPLLITALFLLSSCCNNMDTTKQIKIISKTCLNASTNLCRYAINQRHPFEQYITFLASCELADVGDIVSVTKIEKK